MYTAMDQWAEIRRRVLTGEISKRRACREYDLHWQTLAKVLGHEEPPGFRQRIPRAKPTLGPFLPIIHAILEADRQAPKKQRHTAQRIFDRLREEHGYTGCASIVRAAVHDWKQTQAEVFVPLSQPPGAAQADFGEAEVVVAGERVTAAFFVMTLPYSDAFFCCVFPRECTETFQEGHCRAFAYFGGVPTRISYDNSKIAVATIVGQRGQAPTREFLRLVSHFLFEHHFCRVRRPNEKGHVEVMVGFARRNFMVPGPEADSWAGLNQVIEDRCRADLARHLRGQRASKSELLAEERQACGRSRPTGSRRGGSNWLGPTRCPWYASTAMTTRCRRRAPTSRSPWLAGWTRCGWCVGIDWWPGTGGTGVRSKSPSTRSTTWPCWSESRGHSTTPGRWSIGTCPTTSPSCGGGSRRPGVEAASGITSRCCDY